jgi:hypothetical protein
MDPIKRYAIKYSIILLIVVTICITAICIHQPSSTVVLTPLLGLVIGYAFGRINNLTKGP